MCKTSTFSVLIYMSRNARNKEKMCHLRRWIGSETSLGQLRCAYMKTKTFTAYCRECYIAMWYFCTGPVKNNILQHVSLLLDQSFNVENNINDWSSIDFGRSYYITYRIWTSGNKKQIMLYDQRDISLWQWRLILKFWNPDI